MTSAAQNSKQFLAQKGAASTPSYAFLGNNTTGWYLSATNQITAATNGTAALTIDTSQNVGIGTTSPGTYGGLVVQAASGIGAPLTLLTTDVGANAQTVFKGSRQYQIGTGNASSGFAGQFFVYDGTAGATRMLIDSSGNVGIGTTSPGVKLDVAGSIRGNNNIYTADGAGYGWGSLSAYVGGSSASNFINFTTNSSERMRIDSSGNVGIGTSSPSFPLHITKTATNSYDPTFYGNPSTATNASAIQFNNSGSGTFWVGRLDSAGKYASGAVGGATAGSAYDSAIWNSGAQNITFGTNNTERMRIDSSGNVGIGANSPSTFYGAATQLAVANNQNAATIFHVANNVVGASAGISYRMTGGTGNSYAQFNLNDNNGSPAASFTWGSAVTSVSYGTLGAYPLTWFTNNSERMRIDSSGNVGIGTSSPAVRLQVASGDARISDSGATQRLLRIQNSNGAAEYRIQADGNTFAYNDGYIAWSTGGGSERMRIDSSGNLLVGTTGLSNAAKLQIDAASSGSTITSQVTPTTATDHVNFRNANGKIGTITTTGSATAYNTSSDYRLKENVQPMTDGLATISALKPVRYDWVNDKSSGEGFIAHELQEIIPLAVTGEKDAVNEDGSINSQGVDYSKLVVHLVAAIQELSAKVEALEAKLGTK